MHLFYNVLCVSFYKCVYTISGKESTWILNVKKSSLLQIELRYQWKVIFLIFITHLISYKENGRIHETTIFNNIGFSFCCDLKSIIV